MKKQKTGAPRVHAKRAKGFALQLNQTHWFTVHQVYDWLRAKGATTPEMDAVASLMPNPVELEASDFEETRTTGGLQKLHWSTLKGSRIFRVRAEHIEGAKQILRSASAFLIHGQASCTLDRRADMLDEIGDLDLIVDAAR